MPEGRLKRTRAAYPELQPKKPITKADLERLLDRIEAKFAAEQQLTK